MTVSFKQVLAVSRPISWINTAVPFAVGAYLIYPFLTIELLLGVVYFLFPFNLLMYGVNDIFDYESDIANPRKGGVEGAVIDKAGHKSLWLWIIGLNLVSVGAFAYVLSLPGKLALTTIIFTALAYSLKILRFKEKPLLDSITSSSHFVLPFVVGLLTYESGELISYMLPIAAFSLWGVASHALGAIQDIEPDKQGGIASIATYFGYRRTALFATACYAGCALLAATIAPPFGPGAALLLLFYMFISATLLQKKNAATEARRSWKLFIFGNYLVGFGLAQIILAFLDPFQVGPAVGYIHLAITIGGYAIVDVLYRIKLAKKVRGV